MPLEIRPSLVQAKHPLPTPPPSATAIAFAAPGVRLVHTCAGDSDEIEEGELVEYCSCAKKPKRNVHWTEPGKQVPIHNGPEPTKEPPITRSPLIARSRTRTNSLDSRSRTWHEPITVTSPELSAPTRALRDRRLRDLVIVYETGAKSRKRPRANSRLGMPQSVAVGKDQTEAPIKGVGQLDTHVDVPHTSTSVAAKQPTPCQIPSISPGPHPLPPRPLSGNSHPPSPTKPPFNLQDLASLPHTGQTPDPYFAARVDFLRVVAEKIGLVPQDVVAPWMPHSSPVPCVSPRQASTRDPRLRPTEKDLDTSPTKRRRVGAIISEDGSSGPSRQVLTTTVNPRIPKGISWMLNPETPAESSGASDTSIHPGITRPKMVVDLTRTD